MTQINTTGQCEEAITDDTAGANSILLDRDCALAFNHADSQIQS
jgi:hypothetical protein